MPVYMTFDTDGGTIQRDAEITRYPDEAAALAAAREAYSDAEDVILEPGGWGDCWVKLYSGPPAPRDAHRWRPFRIGLDLMVQRPGTHPGGRCWWVTPRVRVLVPVVQWPTD